MDRLQASLEKNHVKFCGDKNLDPQQELEKAEKAMDEYFNEE